MAFKRFGPDPRKLVPAPEQARIEARLLMEQILVFPGLKIAKDPTSSPKRTGQLIGSIKVQRPRWKGDTLEGGLTVGVEYGRFQEFRHPTKARYLQRAITAAEGALRKRIEGNEALRSLGLKVRAGRGGS